ncbi:MAG: DNA repair protein RadA [Clostridia bacterium]|nr:DNA repair protein RadA [Clostridia bacterium]MBR6110118.1 DNA repair protein RadA [Clostridia bacterium]
MPKEKTKFVCGECGYETAKWFGRCPSCNSWNTLVEMTVKEAPKRSAMSAGHGAVKLASVEGSDAERTGTGIGELDRVLGGGIVAGSVILIGGDPGIGKSTLLMQAASNLLKSAAVLYVSGEESKAQLKLRAARCGVSGELLVMTETSISAIENEVERVKPAFLIIDSIQTMVCTEIASAAGSITQIREVTAALTRIAKVNGCAVFIVGHVTKEGAIAGPRLLEHMVDTVLYFEGDRHDAFRLLRAVKNRFGSTNEIGIFEMRGDGMAEVSDPSEMFLSGNNDTGCAVTCVMEGNRPILVEIQSLLASTVYANPRRMAAGMDGNRLMLLLAVLERRAGIRTGERDVYTNVVGGIRVDDRGADLAVVLAVTGSVFDKRLPERTAVIGEVSLTGEIRPVDRMLNRVNECVRRGYTRVIAPYFSGIKTVEGAEIVTVRSVRDALETLV